MLCSNCSREVKPVVAIDIDGTLGDYHSHFLAFADDYLASYHNSHREYDGSRQFGDWFCNTYDVDLTTFRQIKLAYRQGGMKRTMPVMPDAAKVVREIKEHAEVWLTTTRPYLRLDNVDPDTRFWLDRHHITYDGMLYDEDKYKVLAELVDPERVVAVLDDLDEQYAAAGKQFGWSVPILASNGYNHGNVAVHRTTALSLPEAQYLINHRITQWELVHV